jgi:hypothetical protein
MRRSRLVLATASLLVGPLLVACSGSDGGGGADAEADPTPVVTPTGSPFSFDITGPEVAEPGQTVTAEITNTGRLPDRFRLVSDPVGAVTIAEPEVSLSPEESAEVDLVVVDVPVIVRVQSITSGGQPDGPYLSIGEQGAP